jgi:hypothetical protein
MPSPDDRWHLVRQLQRCGLQAGELTPRPPQGAAPGITIKFGGSLLVRPDWARLLRCLLNASAEPVQILVGGGPVVDGLRLLDSTLPQPAERLHRLAIRAMGVTALMVAEELGLPVCGEPTSATSHCVVSPEARFVHGCFNHLPASWEVTSDSLAAAIATTTKQPLLLVKSVPPPCPEQQLSLHSLAEAGWFDRQFPTAAEGLQGIAWAAPIAATAS